MSSGAGHCSLLLSGFPPPTPHTNYHPRESYSLHAPTCKLPSNPQSPALPQIKTLHRSWSVIPLPCQGKGRSRPGRKKGAQSDPSNPPETCHQFFKGKRVKQHVLQNLHQNTRTSRVRSPLGDVLVCGSQEAASLTGWFPALRRCGVVNLVS